MNSNFSTFQFDTLDNFYTVFTWDISTYEIYIPSITDYKIKLVRPWAFTSAQVLVKYNKDGVVQWYKSYDSTDSYNIKVDASGNTNLLLHHSVNNTYRKIKINSQGVEDLPLLITALDFKKSFVEKDNLNNTWVVNGGWGTQNLLSLTKYDSLNNVIAQSDPIEHYCGGWGNTNFLSSCRIGYPLIDANNNLYFVGEFKCKMKFNNQILTDSSYGSNAAFPACPQYDVFLCKIKSNGDADWIKQFKVNEMYVQGFELRNNLIYVLGSSPTDIYSGCTANFMQVGNLPAVQFSSNAIYLYTIDTSGTNENFKVLYNSDTTFRLKTDGNLLAFKKNSNVPTIGFNFDSPFIYNNTTMQPRDFISYRRPSNIFIGIGDTSCFTSPLIITEAHINTILNNSLNLFPNPYTAETSIAFNLEKDANIKVEVMSTLGEVLYIVTDDKLKAGAHSLALLPKTNALSNGVYFVKYTQDGATQIKRLVKIE